MTKTLYTKDYIADKLMTNDRWLERAILALYKQQTSDEQRKNDAEVRNRRGFSSAHAPFMSKAAKWVLSGKHLDGHHLIKARQFCMHYVKQLESLAKIR